MANFYKDLKLPLQNTNNVMTLNSNHILEATNIPVADVRNSMANVTNLTNRVTNIEAELDGVAAQIQNINGEVL